MYQVIRGAIREYAISPPPPMLSTGTGFFPTRSAQPHCPRSPPPLKNGLRKKNSRQVFTPNVGIQPTNLELCLHTALNCRLSRAARVHHREDRPRRPRKPPRSTSSRRTAVTRLVLFRTTSSLPSFAVLCCRDWPVIHAAAAAKK